MREKKIIEKMEQTTESLEKLNDTIDKVYETKIFRLIFGTPVILFFSIFYWLYLVYWAIPFGKYNCFWGRKKKMFGRAILNAFLLGLPWAYSEIKRIANDSSK